MTHFTKAKQVIQSCTTKQHILAADVYLNYYRMLYGDDVIGIARLTTYLNMAKQRVKIDTERSKIHTAQLPLPNRVARIKAIMK